MRKGDFAIGNLVAYGTNGICTIENIEMISMVSDIPPMPYYVLKPHSNGASTVYVPQNNEKLVSRMRELLTKEEIDEMIRDCKEDSSIQWHKDRRFRNENFHNILTLGVDKDMLLMIACIEKRKEQLTVEGKKLPTTDGNMLKQAEKLVEEEFSHVLDIDPKGVKDYIHDVLAGVH